MAEYNPSKIIKDGNTYNFRDTTKIPLAGSNQISGSLIPSTDGTVNLGSSTAQWNNAYIKSLAINGVACGDILTHNVSEFVNVSTAQTINGNKTFSKILLKSSRIERGSLPSSNITEDSEIEIVDKNNRQILGVFNYYYTDGRGRTSFYAYNSNTTDHDNIAISFDFDNANNQKSLLPVSSNVINLGTSTNKWKSFNGIAPDELGLPTSTYTDVSSYITHFDYTPNTFIAPVSGMFYIDGGVGDVVIENNTLGYIVNFNRNPNFNNCRAIMFMSKGETYSVYCNYQNFTRAKIYHLKGKV